MGLAGGFPLSPLMHLASLYPPVHYCGLGETGELVTQVPSKLGAGFHFPGSGLLLQPRFLTRGGKQVLGEVSTGGPLALAF